MHVGIRMKIIFVLGAALTLCRPVGAATLEELASLSGPDREKILVEGARAEGKVVMYSAMIEDQALRPMNAAFRKKYPFIDAQFWRADTRDLINKALAEVRARSVVADVVEGGGLAPAMTRAGVLASFKLPRTADLPAPMVDPKGLWVATRVSYYGVAYNTRLVSKEELPKSYQDLLDPKWKGKLAWAANTETGGAAMFITAIRTWLGDEKAEAYLRELAKQDVANLSGSPREVVNKVMAGEYAMALNIFLHHPVISGMKGAPVAPLPLEPIPSNPSVMVLLKQAPHPYSALLLMDFMISKEGQEVIGKADYFPSDMSIPIGEAVSTIVPDKIGKTMLFLSEEDMFSKRAKTNDWLKRYFQRR